MESNKMDTKGWKFWVLFVIVPVAVVMSSSIVFYGLYIQEPARVIKTYQQGLIYERLNHHTEAIAEFIKELEMNPDNTDAYFHLGNSYFKLKEYDKAEASIKNILKLKPDSLEARYQLAVITMTRAVLLRKLGKSETIVLDKLQAAENFCKEIIEKDKSFVEAYYLLGDIHLSQGLIGDAIINYKNLLSTDNTCVEGRIAIARLYIKNGELDLAENECNLVLIDLEPDNLAAMVLLSTVYDLKKKYDEALILLKKVIEKEPYNISARIQLGLLHLKRAEYDEAFAEIEYLSKYPSASLPATVYFIKGSVWLHRKEYVKAVSALSEAVLRQPDMAESHYLLAQGFVRLGRIQQAIGSFNTVVRLAPTFLPAKLRLAKLLSKNVDWQSKTVSLSKDILEIKPNHVEALELLGQSYIKTKDFENAELQFRKIIELNPSVGKINMAYLCLVSGQLNRCIRQCEAIINTNPEEIRAYNILALAHMRQGNFDKGVEQYKKVLEMDSQSISTLLNIAKAYLVIENNDEAVKSINNVITLDPKNLQARIILAGIYKKANNIDETAKTLEHIIEINPENVEGCLLAGIYLLQGKTDASINLCNEAIKHFPDNKIIHTTLAVSYQQNEDYVAAIKYSRKAVELNPASTSCRIVLINNYSANAEYSIAKKQIESLSSFTSYQKKEYHELLDLCRLNKDKGKQIALALNRSIFARQAGLFDLAISECKKAVPIFLENVVAKVMLANNYLSTNRYDEAIKVYSEVIKDKPKFTSFYYDLVKAYQNVDNKNEALAAYQNLIDEDSKSVFHRLALAELLFKQGETDKAAKLINDVIKLDSDNLMAHGLLGKVSLEDEDYKKAEKEFSEIIQLSGDSFEGHFNMAKLGFAQGDFDACIKHGKNALKIRPLDVRAHNILGMAFLRKGQINKAMIEFNRIIEINPDFIPAYLNLAKINIANKRPGIAVLLYRAALKVDTDSIDAHLGLGNSYALMGKHSEAITEFEIVLKKYPENINAYISLATVYMNLNKIVKSQEVITNGLNTEPDNPMARYVLAKIFVKKNQIQEAIIELKRVLPDNQKILNLYELGAFYIDIQEYDNAVLTYKQGVEHFPVNYLMWCNLAIAYQLNKEFKNANEACNKAIEIKPDNIIPNLCKVYSYLANGKYIAAKQHMRLMVNIDDTEKEMYLDLLELCILNKEVADKVSYHLARSLVFNNYRWSDRVLQEYDEVIKIAPTNTAAYNAQVDTLILTKEYDKAIMLFNKLIELKPEKPAFYYKLAGIHRRKGDLDEALTQYRNMTRIAPDDITAHLEIGILLEIKGMLEESVKAYQKVIELDSTSKVINNKNIWKAYNNLASIYASKKADRMDEALKLVEKAKELVPDNLYVNDTLGWIFYMNAEYDKAVSLLRAAIRNAAWNPTIRYHLGMAYYKKGFQIEAMAELQRALRISNTFPDAEKAKEVINKIMLSKKNGTGK